ncbi:MAG: hypothetical protein WB392_04600 [Methanotrichaceae archaeon]
MSYIRYPILILFLLVVTAALTYSQVPVKLNGSEGLALLNSLTESHLNQTNESLNGSYNTTNLTRSKDTSSDFWSWGTRPKNYSDYSSSTGTDYLSDPITNL